MNTKFSSNVIILSIKKNVFKLFKKQIIYEIKLKKSIFQLLKLNLCTKCILE